MSSTLFMIINYNVISSVTETILVSQTCGNFSHKNKSQKMSCITITVQFTKRSFSYNILLNVFAVALAACCPKHVPRWPDG